jgi:Glycosyl hydrolases family 18/Chitin recognition protein
MYWNY